jgi:hypothetical protein
MSILKIDESFSSLIEVTEAIERIEELAEQIAEDARFKEDMIQDGWYINFEGDWSHDDFGSDFEYPDDYEDESLLLEAFGEIDLDFDEYTYIRYNRAKIAAYWVYEVNGVKSENAYNEWFKAHDELMEIQANACVNWDKIRDKRKIICDDLEKAYDRIIVERYKAYDAYTSYAALALFHLRREIRTREEEEDDDDFGGWDTPIIPTSDESIKTELENAFERCFAIAA